MTASFYPANDELRVIESAVAAFEKTVQFGRDVYLRWSLRRQLSGAAEALNVTVVALSNMTTAIKAQGGFGPTSVQARLIKIAERADHVVNIVEPVLAAGPRLIDRFIGREQAEALFAALRAVSTESASLSRECRRAAMRIVDPGPRTVMHVAKLTEGEAAVIDELDEEGTALAAKWLAPHTPAGTSV
ncbi:MAG: hypothetical protein ACRENE_08545 [Polyangiaceae bacterium]